MRKIITIVGTRPELIRLSEIIKKLDLHSDHVFVHTGQNFTPELHDQFFQDLGLRKPDYQLNSEKRAVGLSYIGNTLTDVDEILAKESPDAALILGDTNSALAAYACKRRSIPVFHMEAGNRCYDEAVPEESNRRIVDSLSDWLLPYTQRSRENLLREGYHPSKIIVTGNPISEIIKTYLPKYENNVRNGVLVTLHRSENVTNERTLRSIISALNKIAENNPVILSVHPKLEEMLKKFDIKLHPGINASKPFGFREFLHKELTASCVLTDSGTVPEECTLIGTPCVLMRDSTERPELLETNSMILSGTNTADILNAFEAVGGLKNGRIPDDYRDLDVSDKIVKLLLKKL